MLIAIWVVLALFLMPLAFVTLFGLCASALMEDPREYL